MKHEDIGVAYIARLFKVDRDTVKKWNYLFSEFLSQSANPSKGHPRVYIQTDIRVFALVYDYRDWAKSEEDKDYSDIYYALNSGLQHDERYIETSYFNTPLFQDIPSEIDETWKHGVLVGGITPRNEIDFARAYRLAGDVLVDYALKSGEPYELMYPIFYNYRHALELHLKVLVQPEERDHNLADLVDQLTKKYNVPLSPWSQKLVNQFHEMDKGSTTFRYGEKLPSDETWVNLYQLKMIVSALFNQIEHLI